MPLTISIIILNYNSSGFTIGCVRSIVAQTKPGSYEIVVIDNNSDPADVTKLDLLRNEPTVKLVQSRLNLGFAGGNMLGVQAADPATRYYFFLNNDCELRNDVCGLLSQFMDQNTTAGVCTAQMYAGDGSYHRSFSYFPALAPLLFGHGLMKRLQPDNYPDYKTQYTQPVQVPVVTGSAMFVRASVLSEVGGLNTMYFLYCEEEDLCQRVRRRGYASVVVPEARYTHFSGSSTTKSLAIEKEFYISLFQYFRQFHSWPERLLLRLFYTVKQGRKFYKSPIYASLAWFILRGAPQRDSLRYRQAIRQSASSPPSTLTIKSVS